MIGPNDSVPKTQRSKIKCVVTQVKNWSVTLDLTTRQEKSNGMNNIVEII